MLDFLKTGTINIDIPTSGEFFSFLKNFLVKHSTPLVVLSLSLLSILTYLYFYFNGLGLSYNDARSHLDIGRRVVEGLKPGFAQLGSVWLPLPHLLMVPTVWNDFFWHTGLSGALQSMSSFVATGYLIYMYLKKLGVGMTGRLVGVTVFSLNLNILYLQSTAMTELLLIATMMAGVYELLNWFQTDRTSRLIKSAFWIMLSTLIRYDGWFLLLFAMGLIAIQVFRRKGYKQTEGTVLLFGTLAGLGIVLWVVWNTVIFKDPFYFISGPYSAAAQQKQLADAGNLATKGDLFFSIKTYLYAMAYNSNTFVLVLGTIGAIVFWLDKRISTSVRIGALTLLAPLIFNILALFLGQSVLFIDGLSGNTWFNVRYGVMFISSLAIFIGYLAHKFKPLRPVLIGLIALTVFFSFANFDAVTIDDAKYGSSQKNVTEVSGWLAKHAEGKDGFVLISAASHDAIIFSSGLPMSKFIHEGTGLYWEYATAHPAKWARWIVMRTNDTSDSTFNIVRNSKDYKNGDYTLVNHFPFADIYELKPQYLKTLVTKPILGKQK